MSDNTKITKNTNILVIVALVSFLLGGAGFFIFAQQRQVVNSHNMEHMDIPMDHSMMDMTNGLKDKSGEEFDKAFLQDMIIHHEGAVDMANLVLEKSDNEELREFANSIIDAQSNEINQMEKWLDEWYK